MANYNCYALDKNGKPLFTSNGKPDLKNGDIYISVSQILSMEAAGDFLTTWLLNTFGGALDPLKAYKSYMDRVSELGTKLHHFMECDLKGIDYPDPIDEAMLPGIESWISFRQEHKVETVDSERILYSKRLRVAGTVDARLKIDGQLYIVDLKTGSVQPKAFTQLVIYKYMMKELGLSDGSEKLLVLGGSDSKNKISEGGKVQMHTLDTMFGGRVSEDDLFGAFMCLRYLWGLKNIKSRQFEAVIKGMQESLDPMVERFRQSFYELPAPPKKKSKGKQK